MIDIVAMAGLLIKAETAIQWLEQDGYLESVRILRELVAALESLSQERAVLVEGFSAAVYELNDVVDPFILGSLKDHEPDIHTGGRWAKTPQRITAIRKALALIEGGKLGEKQDANTE